MEEVAAEVSGILNIVVIVLGYLFRTHLENSYFESIINDFFKIGGHKNGKKCHFQHRIVLDSRRKKKGCIAKSDRTK